VTVYSLLPTVADHRDARQPLKRSEHDSGNDRTAMSFSRLDVSLSESLKFDVNTCCHSRTQAVELINSNQINALLASLVNRNTLSTIASATGGLNQPLASQKRGAASESESAAAWVLAARDD
jgi:hypothetical protein